MRAMRMKRWWDAGDVAFADLVVGLEYINEANRITGDFHKFKEASDALAAFARGYFYGRFGTLDAYMDRGHLRESAIVRDYVRDALGLESLRAALESPACDLLANLEPQIYDEDLIDLEIRQRDIPKERLPDDVFTAARNRHRTFRNARNTALRTSRADDARRASSALGALLYLVRCNLNHPGKGRFGPDARKGARDQLVVAISLPVLMDLIDRFLDVASSRLAVYGTLGTENANHHLIADLGPPLATGTVNGSLATQNGAPVLSWSNDHDETPVEIFESALLTDKRWLEIDQFEGVNYRRILVPVTVAGSHLVANVYAASSN